MPGGRERGGVRTPFKKITRTNRSLPPRGGERGGAEPHSKRSSERIVAYPRGGERGGGAPFKKIIRTNRSLPPEREEGGVGTLFKKIIKNNRSLCPKRGRGAQPIQKIIKFNTLFPGTGVYPFKR